MDKHTPGPWVVNPLQPNQVAKADGSVSIATAEILHPFDAVAANARLIAAAPDLLAALQGLLDPATNEDGEWYRQAHQAARAAIAKATGG